MLRKKPKAGAVGSLLDYPQPIRRLLTPRLKSTPRGAEETRLGMLDVDVEAPTWLKVVAPAWVRPTEARRRRPSRGAAPTLPGAL